MTTEDGRIRTTAMMAWAMGVVQDDHMWEATVHERQVWASCWTTVYLNFLWYFVGARTRNVVPKQG